MPPEKLPFFDAAASQLVYDHLRESPAHHVVRIYFANGEPIVIVRIDDRNQRAVTLFDELGAVVAFDRHEIVGFALLSNEPPEEPANEDAEAWLGLLGDLRARAMASKDKGVRDVAEALAKFEAEAEAKNAAPAEGDATPSGGGDQ